MKFIVLFAPHIFAMVVPSSYNQSDSDLNEISKDFNNFKVDQNEESKIFNSLETDQDELNILLNLIKTKDRSEYSELLENLKAPTENIKDAMKYCFKIEDKPKEQKTCFNNIAQLFKLFYSKWRGSIKKHQGSSSDHLLNSKNF